MIKKLLIILFVFDFCVASDIYVDQTVPSSCNTYDPITRTCTSGNKIVFKTLSEATAAATNGNTVIFRAGTYGQLNPIYSGTPSLPITFKNYETEAVYFSASPGINLNAKSYLILDGLRVENTTWLESQNSHYNIIKNCTFFKNPNGGTTGNVRLVQSHYNQILNNVISDGNDNLILAGSDYNFIYGNTITIARHSVISIRCGNYNIIKYNYFSNPTQKCMELFDCGVDTSAVPNSFNDSKRNIIEDNIFADAVDYYSTSGGNGIQYAGQDGIIRNNIFYNCNVGLGMQRYSDEALYNNNNRVYNNVFYKNTGGGISLRSSVENNVFLNNIFYANDGCYPDCLGTSLGQITYRSPLAITNKFINNCIFSSAIGQPVIERENAVGVSVSSFQSSYPSVMMRSIEKNPEFMDESSYDFHLKPTSPMIDSGVFLTTTTSAGSGVVIPVNDPYVFSDGNGIFTGDEVQLENSGLIVKIVSINYTLKTITVDSPLTWTSNLGISLPYCGTSPDLGSLEFCNLTLPPSRISNLRISQ